MRIDDAKLMAYADGELGPIEQKRIEQTLIVDPGLVERLAKIAAFDEQMRDAFTPILQAPVPARMSDILTGNIVTIGAKRVQRRGQGGLALAASLILGVVLGMQLTGTAKAPVVVRNGALIAAGPVADALNTQLASAPGDVEILSSFRSAGRYCRVFASTAVDGIACHDGDHWQIRQAVPGRVEPTTEYRQATSADAVLMATAQSMMNGLPLDAAGEQRARAASWR